MTFMNQLGLFRNVAAVGSGVAHESGAQLEHRWSQHGDHSRGQRDRHVQTDRYLLV